MVVLPPSEIIRQILSPIDCYLAVLKADIGIVQKSQIAIVRMALM